VYPIAHCTLLPVLALICLQTSVRGGGGDTTGGGGDTTDGGGDTTGGGGDTTGGGGDTTGGGGDTTIYSISIYKAKLIKRTNKNLTCFKLGERGENGTNTCLRKNIEPYNYIQAEIKNKFVFLKFDCATRLKVNYLGVNICFISDNNEAVTKTLMVTDTKSQHTSGQLKTMLYKIMDEFKIQPSHVLCCITDNASNMVKLVKDFNQDMTDESQAAAVEGSEESLVEENEEGDYVSGASDYESDPEEDVEHHHQPSPVVDDELFDNSVKMSLPVSTSHIRCGMHTLQEKVFHSQHS
jgi:hypothetical protein